MNGRPSQPAVSARAASPEADQPAVDARGAFPGAEVMARSFDHEIEVAVAYERGLVGKAVLALAIVLLVLAIRTYFGG